MDSDRRIKASSSNEAEAVVRRRAPEFAPEGFKTTSIRAPGFEDDDLLAFPSERSIVGVFEPVPASARTDRDSSGATARADAGAASSREDSLVLFLSEGSSLPVFAPVPVSVADDHESTRANARAIVQPQLYGPTVSRRSSRRAWLVTGALLSALSGFSVAQHRTQVPPPLVSRGTGQWTAFAAPAVAVTRMLPEAAAPAVPVGPAPAPERPSPIRAGAPHDRGDIVSIQRMLYRYRDAFSIRDPSAIRVVFPAANEGSLRRRFAAVYDQNLEFDACRIVVMEAGATAWCRGSLQIFSKSNQSPSRLERREWRFTLRRSGDSAWTIATVSPE